jgi:hypothetical protein
VQIIVQNYVDTILTWLYACLMENIKQIEVIKTIGAIYSSQEEMDEVYRYLRETGGVAGRVFVRAMLEKINRDKKAGRYI